ncbi:MULTISPECIES: DUF1127 domain-containing protein [unclassified Sulfitobacter]|jgi:uncharacterized protein YjiS (DUF1127 family)|uniref:DUF1127 domain-containing protein n=1 Tax=unclassified Sulfitobacter TaxID=196795 RepID=UPI0011108C1E|nr:DUF1127 domain-containing protein [Sulfitobacter sp. BSw21498]|tara:strand:+ start:2113 stop:2331 length:219 start_codon:yes stop_codon:yes gene_type:complete
MSYTSTYTAAPVAGLMPKLRMSLNAFRAYSADQRAKRQTFRELSAMNDRDLADIGVARGEIRNIASQAVALR